MERIKYLITYSLLFFISILPFWILYRISDALYLFMRLIKYRNKVILDNLANSFPEKTLNERIKIRNRFYRHFCDLSMETVKLQTISKKQLDKRITIKNLDIINDATKNQRDVIAIAAHYNNWEWVSAINLKFIAKGCGVYHPLKSPYFDHYMLKIRSVFNSHVIPMKDSVREVLHFKANNQRYVLGLISDQSPGKLSIQYKTTFLNQSTPVILGPEKLARKTNDLVVFVEMHKIKRGYYQVNVVKLFDEPKETKPFEITNKHIQHLERIIINNPEYWLWSHRRWKYADVEIQ